MRKAGDVVPVLTDIKERLDKIDNITKDMKIGKILEKEDYDTLVNYNSELARYFAILSDGSAGKTDLSVQAKELRGWQT